MAVPKKLCAERVVLGCERELLVALTAVCVAIIVVPGTLYGVAGGCAVFAIGMCFLRGRAKRDMQMDVPDIVTSADIKRASAAELRAARADLIARVDMKTRFLWSKNAADPGDYPELRLRIDAIGDEVSERSASGSGRSASSKAEA